MPKRDIFERAQRFCPECGKEFYVFYKPIWAYKDRNIEVCSYGCLCSRRRKREEEKVIRKLNLKQKGYRREMHI